MRNAKTARLRTNLALQSGGLGLLFLLAVTGPAMAQDFQSDFNGPEASWQVKCRERDVRLETQERRREGARSGKAEFIRVRASHDSVPLRMEHSIQFVRVLDELTARLWVRSDRPGAVLALRIAFRGATDPATGAPLTLIVTGEKYENVGEWQELKCGTSEKVVNDQLRLLRARSQVNLNRDSMYVDRVIVGCQLAPGDTEFLLDDLTIGPIVPVNFASGGGLEETANQSESETASRLAPAEFRLHRLRVEGKPFYPRVVPFRQERPEVLADAGFNATWVADVEAMTNSGQFRERGVWLTATPPFAKGADGSPLDSEDASLLPFTPASNSVLFWMLGARLTADSRPRLASWSNQIRDADRSFKRPLAADMADDERIASRYLDLVGLSRHVLNSDVSLVDYRDEIIRRRDRAWPGTFCFTWIQTEPAAELLDLERVTDTVPCLEPEQLRLQVYAALAAGCRGLGYWTTKPIGGDDPASRERALAITQLNLELSLLEPWLATGSSVQLIPFTIAPKPAAPPATSFGFTRSQTPRTTAQQSPLERQRERELSAALIRSETGALLLPMWLEERSQFVPGQLAAHNVTIVIPGGGETATAWEITTTGRMQNLVRESVAGGMKIVLPRFDQTAAILITSDLSLVEHVNQRITAIQERSAKVSVELCKLKLERVRLVDEQLQQLGIRQQDGWRLLGQAKIHYDKAEAALSQQQYNFARQSAGVAMQMARILQRAHFDEAVAKLSSPTLSPFSLCFQTLPAHWKLMRAVERSRTGESANKLPSGDLEDLDTLIASGWRHEQKGSDEVRSTAELCPAARKGRFCLRLGAALAKTEAAAGAFNRPLVSVTTPPVAVHAGTVVKISGWLKLPRPIAGSPDGVMISESLLGKTGAVRVTDATDWRQFEFLRAVPESQDLALTISLHGLGEVLLDDLQITVFTPATDLAAGEPDGKSPVKPARFLPLERFDLRRFSPLPRRNN